MYKNRNTDIHHLICSSRSGEGFLTERDINKKEWKTNNHRSLHTLFGNDLPHEIIQRILEMYQDVFREDFLAKVEEVLESANEDIYSSEVLSTKKKVKEDVKEIINHYKKTSPK